MKDDEEKTPRETDEALRVEGETSARTCCDIPDCASMADDAASVLSARDDCALVAECAEIVNAPMRLREQICCKFRLLTKLHATIFRELVPSLTAPQFGAMVMLNELGECSQTELAEGAAIDQPTIAKMIPILKKLGLVKSRRDPGCKRRNLVSLTPEGANIVDGAVDLVKLVGAKTLAKLTEDEQSQFLFLLDKAVGAECAP